ncbi:MAG: acetyl-CoA hydrolase/transferase C-terminal domain-containing protein [Woeseiaceae bacterium]
MSRVFQSATDIADAVVASVGKEVVLGLPIGIGKAVRVVDALYERAKKDPSMSLTIFTGLTLEVPAGGSDLEKRFLAPLVERLYSEWPTPAYAADVRKQSLPQNVTVREFYLRPGAYLRNSLVQQNYASINYSRVATELLELGVNVIANLVAVRDQSAGRYSLASNPEVTLDLLPPFAAEREQGKRVAVVGEVNRNLPYMLGDADLAVDRFDFILDTEGDDFPLFPLPNRRVLPGDYAAAMHAASLIRDGGTLQVGIGSLSDAVAHCLILRQNQPDVFKEVLERLPGGITSIRRQELPTETDPFEKGLFASTELMSDALYALFEAGLIRRPADAVDKAVIHAGFLIGSSQLYNKLNNLSEERRRLIHMKSISSVNTLYGDEQRKRLQRLLPSFVNETMMVTLLGAAVSDALDDGRVVSGVGGQFDFVSMAHSLDDAQSILMLRSTRTSGGKTQSNVRWSYGHTTVPRHHRDLYISEFGIAATRGKTDSQVIEAMLGITDAAFQFGLRGKAVSAGKLHKDSIASVPENTLGNVRSVFQLEHIRSHFPDYPLGTDLTATEQTLAAALEWLKAETALPSDKVRTIVNAALNTPKSDHAEALQHMRLDKTSGFKQRLTKSLLLHALEQTSHANQG